MGLSLARHTTQRGERELLSTGWVSGAVESYAAGGAASSAPLVYSAHATYTTVGYRPNPMKLLYILLE